MHRKSAKEKNFRTPKTRLTERGKKKNSTPHSSVRKHRRSFRHAASFGWVLPLVPCTGSNGAVGGGVALLESTQKLTHSNAVKKRKPHSGFVRALPLLLITRCRLICSVQQRLDICSALSYMSERLRKPLHFWKGCGDHNITSRIICRGRAKFPFRAMLSSRNKESKDSMTNSDTSRPSMRRTCHR